MGHKRERRGKILLFLNRVRKASNIFFFPHPFQLKFFAKRKTSRKLRCFLSAFGGSSWSFRQIAHEKEIKNTMKQSACGFLLFAPRNSKSGSNFLSLSDKKSAKNRGKKQKRITKTESSERKISTGLFVVSGPFTCRDPCLQKCASRAAFLGRPWCHQR